MISFAHHAYLVVGNEQEGILLVKNEIKEKFNLDLEKFPDLYLGQHNFFGVDDSRSLKQRVSNRSFAGGKKFFLVSMVSTTTEAQNALLKLLEEPVGDTHIFLFIRSTKLFLATILSRCEVINISDIKTSSTCPEFLAISPAQRIKTIAEWQNKEELTKDKVGSLLDDIERYLVAKNNRSGLSNLVLARRYLYDRALIPKLVLEYLALVLPQFSKIGS